MALRTLQIHADLPWIYLGYILLLHSPLHGVYATCPGVPPEAFNCDFEYEEPCVQYWETQDIHGVQWLFSKHGSPVYVPGGTSLLAGDQRYDFVYNRVTADHRRDGMLLELISPSFDIRGGCVQFLYHNSLCRYTEDTLMVSVRHIGNETMTKHSDKGDILLRSYSCVAGSHSWYTEYLDLKDIEGTVSLVFSAIQSTDRWGEDGITAVDHVRYYDQSCASTDLEYYTSGDCDFETDMCGYTHVQNESGCLIWKVTKEEIISNRSGDQASGHERNVLGVAINPGMDCSHTIRTYSIRSPQVSVEDEGCMTVRYVSGRPDEWNQNVTSLIVSRVQTDQSDTIMYQFPVSLSDEWLEAMVPLPRGSYWLKFSARLSMPYGINYLKTDVIAIDDVKIHDTSCDLVACTRPYFLYN